MMDRIFGAMIRFSFMAIVAVMLWTVSTINTLAQVPFDGYQLNVNAVDLTTGELEYVGGNVSDTLASCSYNMGLIAATWYNDGMVGSMASTYTESGNRSALSFYDANGEYFIHMGCAPIEVSI